MGVSKAIPSPQLMWELFEAYRDWVESHPIKKHVFVGKDGDEAWEQRDRPLTYEGFCNYLETNGVMQRPDHYFMNYEKRYEDFIGVCSRIRREIRQEQIEKGMAGIYNPSITQRLNGLTEKTDNKSEVTIKGVEVTIKRTGLPQINSEKDIQ